MVVDLENLSNVKTDEVIKFILENISDLVVITNDKFEIEIINEDAHKTITGYYDMNLTGKSLLETIHPKDRKKANGELRKLLKNGLMEAKTRLKCKNGEYIWLKIDGQTFYDTLGNKKIILVGKEFFKHRYFAKSYSTNEDKFKEMLDNLTEIRFWKMLQPKQAVAIYQESQEMLKLIMDNIPQYIAWKDKNLTYLGCNNNFLDLFNIENEEDLLGKKDFDLMWGEEYALSLYMNDSRVLESNAPDIHMVELWQNQEGVKMWFDINRIPLHDLDGNVVGILITLDNITDRNFAEQQLKESEEMFRTIGEQSLMGIGILQDDVFKYVNNLFAKIYGYTVDELLNWPELEYQKLTHPADLLFTAEQARKKQLGEKDVINRYQFRGVKKSGEIIWLEIFSKSISYEGYPADLVALIDVSEKKLAEQKLKDSEAKFRYLVSSSPAIIYTSDVSDDYGATFMSENLKILTGYTPEEFTSDSKFWLNHIHPDDKERIKTGLAELFVKNYHYHEYRFKFKDGTYHWMRDEINLIKDENGTPIETIGYWNDITEHKLAEQKLIESEHNLKESEAKYHHLFNSTPYGIWLVNLKGVVIDCNITMNKFLSVVTRDDLIGKNFRDILQLILKEGGKINIKELEETFIERFKLLLKQGYIDPIEVEVARKDGIKFWLTFETSFVNLGDETLIQVFIKDITHSKENELKIKESENKLKILNKELEVNVENRTEQLKSSKENYQLITENVNDFIGVTDLDFNYEFVNKVFEETLGYNMAEIVGRRRLDLVHPEDLQIVLSRRNEILDRGGATFEIRIKEKDGNYLWTEINGKMFLNNLNEKKILLVGKDITERKKNEQRLSESEEKYRIIAESSLMGMFITQENEFKYVNEAMSDIYEFSIKEIMKWTIREFINKIHPDDRDYAVERLRKRLAENSELSSFFSFRIITKSGKEKWIESSTKPINFRGKLANLSMILDITDRKQAEEKLRESEKKLREQNIELKKLDEIKNDFITMAAHELKTPLISISGYTEYILTKHEDSLNEITPEIKKDLTIVQKNIKRLQNLMDQLLDVMKIESKKIELVKHPMNVKKIINNCIDELSYIIQEKNHNLVIKVDEEIILNIDSERFFEIISNLLSNAVKFSPKNGTIEISADQKDDGTYLFKVRDNGIGLKADELGKLFQKFHTVREYSGENYMKGTGIGLFISRGFVEAHGGKIWATSDGDNKGTTFSFTIPY